MPRYHFRVRFRIQEGWYLDHDERAVELQPSAARGAYALRGLDAASIRDARWLALHSTGDGFPSQDEAVSAGVSAKSGVRWCSAQLRVGVDLGDDRIHGGASDYVKEKSLEERGIRLLNETHGLKVYEEDPEYPTRFVSVSANPQVGRTVDDFEMHFSEAVSMDFRLSEKQELAFELYGLSHFEASPRARFVTLVSAIEAVMDERLRSAEATAHVERLIELTRGSGLRHSEIQSLTSGLNALRRESITKAGRVFVAELLREKEYGGRSAEDFFRYCYNVRSELVHGGSPSDSAADVGLLAVQLDELVADLLGASVRRLHT